MISNSNYILRSFGTFEKKKVQKLKKRKQQKKIIRTNLLRTAMLKLVKTLLKK